jgi:hypothetical protein
VDGAVSLDPQSVRPAQLIAAMAAGPIDEPQLRVVSTAAGQVEVA